MPNSPILFSIVIPTYNRAHLISATIESVLTQGYQNYEVLIIDDGSTDNTGEVVQKYLSDKVFYHRKSNAERAAARNTGTLLAKGDYVNWFDSDDIMFPDHLQIAANFLVRHDCPEVLAQGHQYQHMSGIIQHIFEFPKDVNQKLYTGNLMANSPVIVRRDIALANPFNEDRELSGSEDYELWLRLAAKYKINYSSKVTLAVIDHDERSMLTMIDPAQLIKRFNKFIYYTTQNEEVVGLLGNKKGYFLMKNYLILAVSLVNNNHLEIGRKYIGIAIKSSPTIVFERGFYAFIKHYLRHAIS